MIAEIFVAVFATTIAVFVINNLGRLYRHYQYARNIPGPPGWPLVGNLFDFSTCLADTIQKAVVLTKTYGPVFRVWLGPCLYIVITGGEEAQQVLKHPKVINRPAVMSKIIKPMTGNGLLTLEDDKWRAHRKLISPAFNYKVLETYIEVFWEKANILSDIIEKAADGRVIDLHENFTLCMLDAICATVIGVDMNIQHEGKENVKYFHTTQSLIFKRFLRPWLQIDWLYPFTADGKTMRSMAKYFENLSTKIISSKIKAAQQSKEIRDEQDTDKKRYLSFLDMVIDTTGKGDMQMSARDIIEEVKTLFFAGADTTATAIAYALVLIGMHADVQEKLYQELEEAYGGGAEVPTFEDLRKLKYLDCVIKETLRLFPIAANIPRVVPEDIELANGMTLPEGSNVIVFSFPTQRSEQNFNEPEKFWPERWLVGNDSTKNMNGYLPFGSGVHTCIGQKYAMINMKTTFSCLLRKFKIVSDGYTMEELRRIELCVTTNSSVGYKIRVFKR